MKRYPTSSEKEMPYFSQINVEKGIRKFKDFEMLAGFVIEDVPSW